MNQRIFVLTNNQNKVVGVVRDEQDMYPIFLEFVTSEVGDDVSDWELPDTNTLDWGEETTFTVIDGYGEEVEFTVTCTLLY